MTKRAAAGRYARALLDATRSESDPQKAGEELDGFAALVAAHPELGRSLTNPAVPAPQKRAVVNGVLERMGGVTPTLAKLLRLLADRDRVGLLPELAEAYRERLLEHLKVVRAVVTTAVELPAEQARALERSLAEATGKEVRLVTQVDPAVIGGVVARIGSSVYDGSIARQLERLRERLAEGG